MGKTFQSIPEHLVPWIMKQHVFYSASTPLPPPQSSDGTHKDFADKYFTNISPKDMKGFQVVNRNKVRYQDLSGSGVETIAHLRQPGNGKLTLMFVAFEGPPQILRLLGHGRVYERSTPEFDSILPPEDPQIRVGCRAIIELDIVTVLTSCGYSIPLFDHVGERTILDKFAKKRRDADLKTLVARADDHSLEEKEAASDEHLFSQLVNQDGDIVKGGMREYWNWKNARSRDRLMGLEKLARVNDPRDPYGKGPDGVAVVLIAGNEVRMRMKPDGSCEEVDRVQSQAGTRGTRLKWVVNHHGGLGNALNGMSLLLIGLLVGVYIGMHVNKSGAFSMY